MTEWNPTAGPRIAKAWDAIRGALLVSTDGLCKEDIWEVAYDNSDLRLKTCVNLTRDAMRHGYLKWAPSGSGRKVVLTDLGKDAA